MHVCLTTCFFGLGWGAYHLKMFPAIYQAGVLFIIYPIKHDVKEYFLLTESLRPKIMALGMSAEVRISKP